MKEAILPTQPIEMDKGQLDYWKGEIRASLKRQKHEFIDRVQYERCIKYLEAEQTGTPNSMWCIMDEFSPAVLSVVSSVYYQNPTVQVDAKNPDADKPIQPSMLFLLQHPEFKPFNQVDLVRSALIYDMEHTGMKDEMQTACFDLQLAGYACIEANHKVGDDESPDQDIYQEEDKIDGMLNKMVDGVKGMVDKFLGGKNKNDDEVAEEVARTTQKDLYTDTSIKSFVKRYNPLDILFDPRAMVFKESRWIGKRVRMTQAEFYVKYPQFKGKMNLANSEAPELTYAEHVNDANKKIVNLYEIEIKKKGPRNCIAVIHMGLDEVVDYYERPIITNKFAIKYGCVDKYGKIYPMSRGHKALKPQDDINHYMTVQFEHVDRAQRKIGYWEDGLTEAGKAAMRSSDAYALVAKNVANPVFETMPAPQVVIENKEIVAAMRESLNKAIGTNELAKSGDSDNDTLGQDELQNNAFQQNVNAIQDALQDIADQVLDAKKDIILQVWDNNDYFKVTGIQGGDAWYDPSMGPLADILIGDYSTRTNIASAARPNPYRERKELMEMNTMITSPQMVQFAMMHGKKPSMETLYSLLKNFNINPEMVYEDLEPMMPPGIPGQPGQMGPDPNAIQQPEPASVPEVPSGQLL